jgi:hypothetical protein
MRSMKITSGWMLKISTSPSEIRRPRDVLIEIAHGGNGAHGGCLLSRLAGRL